MRPMAELAHEDMDDSSATVYIRGVLTELESPDALVRLGAVKRLHRSILDLAEEPGTPALFREQVVPVIISALNDFHPGVREQSVKVLQAVSDGLLPELIPARLIRDRVVPALIAALKDTDEPTHQAAITALGYCKSSETVLPILIELLRTESGKIADRAAAALADRLRKDSPTIGPLLIDLLRQTGQRLRSLNADPEPDWDAVDAEERRVRHLVTLLGGVRGQDPGVAAALVGVLANEYGYGARDPAIEALGRLGGPVEVVAPVLLRALDEGGRVETITALGRLRPRPPEVEQALIAALGDRHPWERQAAFSALLDAGSASLPAVLRAMTDPRPRVQEGAVEVLWELKEPRDVVFPALVEALGNQHPPLRCKAALALGELGCSADMCARQLARGLGDDYKQVRSACMRTLSRLGRAAVPALNEVREHPDERVRARAIRVLARIAPSSLDARGLERMGDEALKLIGKLEVFYWIGVYCRERRREGFSFTKVAPKLPAIPDATTSNSSIRRHLEDVSAFFRAYYKRFEGIEVPADEDGMSDDASKFISRVNGAREQKICPVGWRAWEETREYLMARGKLRPSIEDVDKAHVVDA